MSATGCFGGIKNESQSSGIGGGCPEDVTSKTDRMHTNWPGRKREDSGKFAVFQGIVSISVWLKPKEMNLTGKHSHIIMSLYYLFDI